MSRTAILVDSGPLVALLNRADARHGECVEVAKTLSLPLFTCWPVITEVAYLVRRQPHDVRRFITQCDGSMMKLLDLAEVDLPEIARILQTYGDQGFDLADAALMHLSNREGIRTVFTLDCRHFSLFRMQDGGSLQLLP